MDFLIGILVAVGGFLLFLACFGWGQPRIPLNVAHWSNPIEGLVEPADLFYARVYQRLKQRLEEAGLPDSKIGFGPGHLFGNRTIFGARPRYLIVKYSHLTIYLYAFPLPLGLYVSYWAFSKYTAWENHPVLRWLLFWREYQMTIYQYDVTDMCLTTIDGALHEVIDEYCSERGLKPLEEFEKRPVLNSFYARYKQGSVPQQTYVLPIQSGVPIQGVSSASTPSGSPISFSNSPTSNSPSSNFLGSSPGSTRPEQAPAETGPIGVMTANSSPPATLVPSES